MMNMKNLLSGAALAVLISGSGLELTAASAQNQEPTQAQDNAPAQPADGTAATPTQSPAQTEQQATPGAEAGQTQAAAEAGENRLIATVNDVEIRQADVLNAIRGLPPQVQQMPPQMLLPIVVEQLLTRELILERASAENLRADPTVVAIVEPQIEALRNQAVVNAWLERELAERITEARISEAYEQFQAANPDSTVTLVVARPQLEQALRQQAMQELSAELREGATVVFFDPSGNPLPENAAGQPNATGQDNDAPAQEGTATSGEPAAAGQESGADGTAPEQSN